MNNKLKFGLFIFTFLLILFLFYRFTNYTEYLSIVPNSSVMTAIRPKRLYKIVLTSLTFSSGLNIPTDAFTFIDYTSKPTPSAVSTIDTGIRGSDFSDRKSVV